MRLDQVKYIYYDTFSIYILFLDMQRQIFPQIRDRQTHSRKPFEVSCVLYEISKRETAAKTLENCTRE